MNDIIEGFMFGTLMGTTMVLFIIAMHFVEKAYGEFAVITIGLILGGGLVGALFGAA